MFRFHHLKNTPRAAVVAALACAAIFAGCGGGSSGLAPITGPAGTPPPSGATATPVPTATPKPTSTPVPTATPTPTPPSGNYVLLVGPSRPYLTIASAVAVADADNNLGHYYDIQIAPGTYTNDFAQITRPMTLEVNPSQPGQLVLLNDTIPLPNGKGIILTTASLVVNGLTFQGANIADALGGNGAGIRDQNTAVASLLVENSTFVNNQEGILEGDDLSETITVTNSTFKNNGNPNPAVFQHAAYFDSGASVTVTNSLFCGQLIGHDIKSRAMVTTVTNNRIYDGEADSADGCGAGTTSLGIDTPNGGVVSISNNSITQGQASQNSKMVAYGEEGMRYSTNSLMFNDNVFTNIGTLNAIGVYDPPCILAHMIGNVFTNVATPVSPASCAGP